MLTFSSADLKLLYGEVGKLPLFYTGVSRLQAKGLNVLPLTQELHASAHIALHLCWSTHIYSPYRCMWCQVLLNKPCTVEPAMEVTLGTACYLYMTTIFWCSLSIMVTCTTWSGVNAVTLPLELYLCVLRPVVIAEFHQGWHVRKRFLCLRDGTAVAGGIRFSGCLSICPSVRPS